MRRLLSIISRIDDCFIVFPCHSNFYTIFSIIGDEFLSGGKDGVGKGATSFLQNVIGGTFFAVGKVTGKLLFA